ncbi:MAG: ferrous iron transport protein B [Caldilineaceae bacterium]|nr:ferrous iron transport protein B [Caldilineaceae bacterium]
MVTIGLAGNPNAGKSTIFNALTGSRQHVGNWPGKTVEKKEGRLRVNGQEVIVVDLPGTYSLSAFSLEEIIARDFIVNGHPDAVICVVDAANLERNLYLVMQILEMGVPVIVALNMSDVAASRGIQIDGAKLSANLGGAPVIETVGNRDLGIDALKSVLLEAVGQQRQASPHSLTFGPALDREIDGLSALIQQDPALQRYPAQWLAIKLLESDAEMIPQIRHNDALATAAITASARITAQMGDDPDTLIAEARYSAIAALVRDAVRRPRQDLVTASDRLDGVMTHRIWGVPIFLGLMWLVFQLTANVSAPFVDFVDGVINGPLARWAGLLLATLRLGGTWAEALLLDGIIAGVGGVLVFVPVLMTLYLAIAILEDTGYMARAAFVMDRLMSRLGLHGKSFLPLLVGFGCTVPAIYATRTLENERDRKITGFLATFMSCGARLPVYVIFGSALFGAAGGNLIFAMYMTGIGVAVLTSLLFTRVIFRNKPVPPFVMELPPYRAPNLKTVFNSMTERTISFVRKAGTVILLASMAVWLLLSVPARGGVGSFTQVSPEDSIFGAVSKAAAPLFAPAGFGTWQASGALVTGFLAKEVVVATMSQVYMGEANVESPEDADPAPTFVSDVLDIAVSFGRALVLTVQEVINIAPRTANLLLGVIPGAALPEANFLGIATEEESLTTLQSALASSFTPLSAVAFCVFILLYLPCMAATAAMRHEFGNKWTLAQIGYTLGVAWLAATLVFQIGALLGWGS